MITCGQIAQHHGLHGQIGVGGKIEPAIRQPFQRECGGAMRGAITHQQDRIAHRTSQAGRERDPIAPICPEPHPDRGPADEAMAPDFGAAPAFVDQVVRGTRDRKA